MKDNQMKYNQMKYNQMKYNQIKNKQIWMYQYRKQLKTNITKIECSENLVQPKSEVT